MEGSRHGGTRARTSERGRPPPPRRHPYAAAHRPHARFGPRRPGEDRGADGGWSGTDREASGVGGCQGCSAGCRRLGRRRLQQSGRPREEGEAVTSIDTERFREALLDERKRVEHALATLRDQHPGTLDEEVEETAASDNHMAETATATLGREIDYTLGENSGQVLADIDSALQRIDDGTYGTCVNCSQEIPIQRLEAHPTASLCIDCKRRAEGG